MRISTPWEDKQGLWSFHWLAEVSFFTGVGIRLADFLGVTSRAIPEFGFLQSLFCISDFWNRRVKGNSQGLLMQEIPLRDRY